jgi:hypothetical protein
MNSAGWKVGPYPPAMTGTAPSSARTAVAVSIAAAMFDR